MKDKTTKAVAFWIFLGIVMLVVQVLLGGITRLTGSGLSITEWKPLMGALPPLTEEQWQKSFMQYQQIAQYKYLNQHFTLENFKFIFFWEWFHRLWARMIGVVFLIPFIFFWVKGYFKKWMIAPLVILFILGALQGAIGWIMVQSGLNDNDLYVSHIRLAAHFMAAMVLIAYALIFWLELAVQRNERVAGGSLLNGAVGIGLLICIQLVFGAFMAGLKAAASASTWPDINGNFLPADLFAGEGFWHNIVYNKIAIHFIHRTLAYLVALCIVWWWLAGKKIQFSGAFNRAKNFTLTVVVLQVMLGILTVLNSHGIVPGRFGRFEWLALLHQLAGMLLLLCVVADVYLTSGKRSFRN